MPMQTTFGNDFGLAVKVPVARHHRNELEGKEECDYCGQLVPLDAWDEDIECCEDCKDTEFAECYDCENSFHNSDLTSDNSRLNHVYCESCYDDNFTNCQGCGESSHNEELTICSHDDRWCDSCYSDNFTHCVDCDSEICLDNGGEHYSNDDGETYCSRCRASHSEEWEPKQNWSGSKDYDKIGSPRKFGIELESSKCDDYYQWAKDTDWGAKSDGSIEGMEFVSPPMHGNDGYDSIMEFCQNAIDNDCQVNKKCGFHLHIDLSDTTADQRKAIALAYHYTRKLWAKFVHPDRRDTSYARYSSDSQFNRSGYWDRDKIVKSNDHPNVPERYIWVNWRSFQRFKTVEIRSHEPTFDSLAVVNWVKAHTRFIDCVREMSVGQVTRVFGCESDDAIMRELRHIWADHSLADYYLGKTRAVA